MDISAKLQQRIQEAIDAGEITLYSLAKSTGLSYYTVSRFMSNERPDIRASTINILCDYFGLTLCEESPKKKGKK